MVPSDRRRRLVWHGVFVFVLGLLTGAVVPVVRNPRMGLAAHVGGVLSGMLLMLVGLTWGEIKLRIGVQRATFWLFLYAGYAGWLAQLLAAVFGTSRSTPIGGAGFEGTLWQEAVVFFVAISFSIAILVASILALWGLRQVTPDDSRSQV